MSVLHEILTLFQERFDVGVAQLDGCENGEVAIKLRLRLDKLTANELHVIIDRNKLTISQEGDVIVIR